MTEEEIKRTVEWAEGTIKHCDKNGAHVIPAPWSQMAIVEAARAISHLHTQLKAKEEKIRELEEKRAELILLNLQNIENLKKAQDENKTLLAAVMDARKIIRTFSFANDTTIFDSIIPGLTWLDKYAPAKTKD